MLNLAESSDPAWAPWAIAHIDELLVDHAHCEKKAASTAISLIFRHPEHPSLMVPLARLAREELEHFEEVVAVIRARGGEFRRLRPSPYAGELMAAARSDPAGRLIDTLLCCALIEARSCERMQLLAEALDDPELAGLYRGLVACEARHHASYVELCRSLQLVDADEVRRRLHTLAVHEAEVLRAAPAAPRIHGGAPP